MRSSIPSPFTSADTARSVAANPGNGFTAVPLNQAVRQLKTVPTELYEEVKTLFRR